MCEPESSPICQKWKAAGGEAVLGKSVGKPEFVLDGQAVLQRFKKGAIFVTNSYGAIVFSQEIFEKWESLASVQALPGSAEKLQKYLGLPVKDTVAASSTVEAVYFERGMIVFNKMAVSNFTDPRTNVVYGWNYDKYRTLGEMNGPLGLPIEDTRADVTFALISKFEGGEVYWHHFVGGGALFNGPILTRWKELGGVGGMLGVSLEFPITDEQPVMKDGQEIGRVSRFLYGAIYFSPNTGAFEVKGPILKAWEEQFGGAAGDLGFPTSGEKQAPKTNKIFNNFEHGMLSWDFDAPPDKSGLAVKNMEFFVQRFIATDDDGLFDDDLEVFVNATIKANGVDIFNDRLPSGGTYPAEKDVDLTFPIPGVVTGETVVDFDFHGKEEDLEIGGIEFHDTLGTVTGKYNLDNNWFLDKGLFQFDDGKFHVVCGMRLPSTPLDPDPQKFRAQGFWSFDNFDTDDLTRDQYAATFLDVDAGTDINLNPESWLDQGWENLFYNLVYKDVAEPGNCFGMCVESIYAQVGRSFFTEPIFKFPADATGLVNEINIKHGYQCGASVIDWFVGQFLTASTHDPVGVFQNTQDAYERGDYPVISMSDSFFEAGGHVVRPYAWNKVTDDHWIISVANPNNPATEPTPTDNDAEGNVIHIDVDTGGVNSKFRFQMAADKLWEGGQWFGGRMHYIPYSRFSTEPRTPGYEVLALLALGTIVLVGSAGESHQISDEAGNTFYEPDLAGPPKRWEDIRRNGDTLLGNVARMPLFGGGGPVPEIYFARNTGATLQHRIAPRPETPPEEPYHWLMRSPTLSAAIALQASSSVEDTVSIERMGTTDQALALSVSPAGPTRKAELWLTGWRGLDHESDKWFHLHDLSLAPGHQLGMRLNEAGEELVVKNEGPEIKCQVTIKDSNTREVVLGAGKWTRIRPNWQQPGDTWVTEEATPSLRHFMERRGLPPSLGVRNYFPTAQSIRELIQA